MTVSRLGTIISVAALAGGLVATGWARERAPAPVGTGDAVARRCSAFSPRATGRTLSTQTLDGAGGNACQVDGVLTPVPGSRVGFRLLLPAQWNGRLEMLGNGGYSSAMPTPQMHSYLERGYAVVATDTGHQGDDPDFAVGHPQAIIDWGWRAIHLTALTAKDLVRRYYGRAARFSYFVGCSTGGHQAFSEAQRFPGDFNGIVAGAPGYDRVRLNSGFLWQYLSNHRRGDDRQPILGQAELDLLQTAAVKACRAANGGSAGGLSEDTWLDDPLQCRFDPAQLACRPGQAQACLSPDQVSAARAMYAGATDERGRQVFFPWPKGSEAGWSRYWADPANPHQPMRVNFWRIWAFRNPQWDWWNFRYGADLDAVRARLSGTVDASSPDLSRFAARGGRLIHYHGLADPVVPPLDSVDYHRQVLEREQRTLHGDAEAAQTKVASFYRLFLAPGVGHCVGGDGPDTFNTQDAIEAWVERGQAPAHLIASRGAAPTAMSRPLCPYPQIARYRAGDRTKAESFVCITPQSGKS